MFLGRKICIERGQMPENSAMYSWLRERHILTETK